jgi:hypothetical protein
MFMNEILLESSIDKQYKDLQTKLIIQSDHNSDCIGDWIKISTVISSSIFISFDLSLLTFVRPDGSRIHVKIDEERLKQNIFGKVITVSHPPSQPDNARVKYLEGGPWEDACKKFWKYCIHDAMKVYWRSYWRFYSNTVAGSWKSLLQCWNRISNTIVHTYRNYI